MFSVLLRVRVPGMCWVGGGLDQHGGRDTVPSVPRRTISQRLSPNARNVRKLKGFERTYKLLDRAEKCNVRLVFLGKPPPVCHGGHSLGVRCDGVRPSLFVVGCSVGASEGHFHGGHAASTDSLAPAHPLSRRPGALPRTQRHWPNSACRLPLVESRERAAGGAVRPAASIPTERRPCSSASSIG